MRSIYFLIIIILSASASIIQGCKTDTRKYILLDPSLKKAYSFQKGTYWVFMDSLTGRIDSFVVTDYINSFIDLYNNTSAEQAIMTISQYNIFPHDDDSLNQLNIYLRNTNQLQPVYVILTNQSYQYFNYAPIDYPFSSGRYVSPTIPKDTITTTEITSLTIHGQIFSNIAAIKLQNTYMRSTMVQFNDVFYFNEIAGLVKITMDHAADQFQRRWEVLRYDIKR